MLMSEKHYLLIILIVMLQKCCDKNTGRVAASGRASPNLACLTHFHYKLLSKSNLCSDSVPWSLNRGLLHLLVMSCQPPALYCSWLGDPAIPHSLNTRHLNACSEQMLHLASQVPLLPVQQPGCLSV